MKKILTLLIIVSTTLSLQGQVINYRGVEVSTSNHQQKKNTKSYSDVEGLVSIKIDMRVASFSFTDLFTDDIVTEEMTIITACISPRFIEIVARNKQNVDYEITVDYAERTVTFIRVSQLADIEQQSNRYPHCKTYVFKMEGSMYGSPQRTDEERVLQKKRKK